jgi:hypothetical protein
MGVFKAGNAGLAIVIANALRARQVRAASGGADVVDAGIAEAVVNAMGVLGALPAGAPGGAALGADGPSLRTIRWPAAALFAARLDADPAFAA